MKLIDLLNKIANGEIKEGTKIKLIETGDIFTFEYKNNIPRLIAKRNGGLNEMGIQNDYNLLEILNKEVEIIEESDEIDIQGIEEFDKEKAYETIQLITRR